MHGSLVTVSSRLRFGSDSTSSTHSFVHVPNNANHKEQARADATLHGEQSAIIVSERDFFKAKWAEAFPEEANALGGSDDVTNNNEPAETDETKSTAMEGAVVSPIAAATDTTALESVLSDPTLPVIIKEKKAFVSVVVGYIRAAEELRAQLGTLY